MDTVIMHYGTPRHSGRYPWGSGDNPYQHEDGFLQQIAELRSQGFTEKQIADGFKISTSRLRALKTIQREAERAARASEALRLKDKGYSATEIGRRMGINESSVRSLLDPALKERASITTATANMLKQQLKEKEYIDVGVGVEHYIGITRNKLKDALVVLQEEGYSVHRVPVEQLGTGQNTTVMVLAPPGTTYREVAQNKDKIRLIKEYSNDGGRSYLGLEPVKSISSDKILIKYKEDGGSDRDGLIELRPGAEGIDLGNSAYAQVRIGVDDKRYMKGMAIYGNDFPKGVDAIYYTNKPKSTPAEEVFKKMKTKEDGSIDQDNPFGATIKVGGQKGVLNIISEEGDWKNWSKDISSQMLSKQKPAVAKRQLDLAYNSKKEEYDTISSLTNPAVKKKLLESFSDDCDASSSHLKAAGFPRQAWHVILPFPDMKNDEIYAPNYNNGEKVVLIRHPHGGKFEIPELTVNNKNKAIKDILGNAPDGVGIHPRVAERLSGADFDGDTVLVIPNRSGSIKSKPSLKDLENFDPRISYPAYKGMEKIKPSTMQKKMGDISNLITDMTIKGANDSELARAVRHSMVVIDSEKHNLNYKQSYDDNGIAALKTKYQGGATKGASTLISRSNSVVRVESRKPRSMKDGGPIDPETGRKVYTKTGEKYVNKSGKVVTRTDKSTNMLETDDAYSLSSGTPMENVYASYANKLKSLANRARLDYINTPSIKYSPSAKKVYQKEVNDLKSKLSVAQRNAPLERSAQILANKIVSSKKKDNPSMSNDQLKKIKGQALVEARARTGAGKTRIEITPKEWDAIQSGAVSNNFLTQILNNTNLDLVKEYATPRTNVTMTPSRIARARAMLNAGKTQAEVALALGVSTSTISKIV